MKVSDSLDVPLPLGNYELVFFRDRLFIPERPPKSASEREEIALRVKKAVYEEDAEIVSLKAAVANLEAAIQLSRSGARRESIPEDVKLVVWTRDGGACVRCRSKQDLHFDHIIPVSKGGGNQEANIQMLCQLCNLRKSDKISTA
ncbi:MAG TPA: HNH endonuclease [Blastocatellia bacterium]|nr:HNH endonuclease [Blastocatellia bacterium]